MDTSFLIYGANGYTGELAAREAVARGLRPLLAGRNAEAVASLARELGLEHRAFALDDAERLAGGLRGVSAVLHCAGPFSRTAAPMAAACLQERAHYLDVTGEVDVFESLAAADEAARAAGVMLLPGVGFDVVPSDCLAAHLSRRLPEASHLVLAFMSKGGISRGTATTAIEKIDRGGLVRRDGKLTPVPAGWKSRPIDFGDGYQRVCLTIPWGDLATAWRSTGIPNIEVYMATPRMLRVSLKLSGPLRPLLGSAPVQSLLKRLVRSRAAGPSAHERATGWTRLWGEATSPAGGRAESRLRAPEGYTLTAQAAITCVERVLKGEAPPGFQTPAKAFGPDLILAVPGVDRVDVV